MKTALRLLGCGLVLLALCMAYAFLEARSAPRMRTFEVRVVKGPIIPRPLRIAFLSDTHLAGPDNNMERLHRLVAQINAARPDVVLLGGDYASEPKFAGRAYSLEESVKPFAGFKAPLGVFAVLGNHDYWAGPDKVRRALEKAGVTVLANQAVRRGPLAIGGIDDDFTRHADVKGTARAVAAVGGVPIYFTHSPDLYPGMPSGMLLLAGHTHCGQVVLPLIGSPWVPSQYGNAYRCGKHRKYSRMLIVTAGIGTTGLPFRLGAPPDWWLVTVTGGGSIKGR